MPLWLFQILLLLCLLGLIAKETKKWLNNLEGTDDTEIPTLDK